MSSLTYTNPPGWGTHIGTVNHMAQAVLLPTTPPTIKISGQGGWDLITGEILDPSNAENIAQQVDLAFANVDNVLRNAGSRNRWGDVYLVRVYFVELWAFEGAAAKGLSAGLKKWCEGISPW
ncbi:hypothetical protein LTR10_012279 [Elasticomyces elasticus]|nr:hypothetical protein LTR10_012279 [Elasticomyces elasticus]KAK4965756.1 hypothetical protein LTR42_011769 [Elasticomyces elasticus]